MQRELSYEERKAKRREVAFVVTIVVLTALSILFTTLFITAKASETRANEEYRALAETTYRKSYYSLLYNVDGLEGASNKLTVASGKATRQEYLADMTAYATAAAENMSAFTPEETGDSKMLKFINQTGDFAKYLDDKLNKGGAITDADRRTIEEINASVAEIKRELAALSDEVERSDFSFVDALKEQDGAFGETLAAFESKEIDYPSMIYDGPFSDSLSVREAKALKGEEIDEEGCRRVVRRILDVDKNAEISVRNGSKSVFECYEVEAMTPLGRAYLTIAKKGGFPVSVNLPEVSSTGTHIEAKDAERYAESYVRDLGIPDMKAVWASLYENVYYINLAPERDGVILYPDLVKVKVAADNGKVIGMESLNYIYNHVDRTLAAAVVTEQEAAEAISEYIDLSSCRLALVPTKGDGEALAYEFYGTKGADKYFVYVDAMTGEEMKIMRVLDGSRGLLLV